MNVEKHHVQHNWPNDKGQSARNELLRYFQLQFGKWNEREKRKKTGEHLLKIARREKSDIDWQTDGHNKKYIWMFSPKILI